MDVNCCIRMSQGEGRGFRAHDRSSVVREGVVLMTRDRDYEWEWRHRQPHRGRDWSRKCRRGVDVKLVKVGKDTEGLQGNQLRKGREGCVASRIRKARELWY